MTSTENMKWTRCPDCNAPATEGALNHEPTCSAGLLLDGLMTRDAQFFTDHPGATEFWRPLELAEILEQQLAGIFPIGEGLQFGGRVRVTRLSSHARTRDMGHTFAILATGSTR